MRGAIPSPPLSHILHYFEYLPVRSKDKLTTIGSTLWLHLLTGRLLLTCMDNIDIIEISTSSGITYLNPTVSIGDNFVCLPCPLSDYNLLNNVIFSCES